MSFQSVCFLPERYCRFLKLFGLLLEYFDFNSSFSNLFQIFLLNGIYFLYITSGLEKGIVYIFVVEVSH